MAELKENKENVLKFISVLYINWAFQHKDSLSDCFNLYYRM